MLMNEVVRVPSVDLLRGAAILWVLLIHARPIENNPVMVHVFNHAAPIFIVLFGFNAASWWMRRPLTFATLGEWFRSRVRRLVLPAWVCLAIWWVLVLTLSPSVRLDPVTMLLQIMGWWRRIGTGWFVTLIMEASIGFPIAFFLSRALQSGLLLGIGVIVTVWGLSQSWSIANKYGLLAWFVFPPVYVAHVFFGIWMARARPFEDRRAIVTSIFLVGLGIFIVEATDPGLLRLSAKTLMVLPLTLALLAASRPLCSIPYLSAGLFWLGTHSYEMYLGQLLAHNAIQFASHPLDPLWTMGRWSYFGLLLAGGIAFTKGYGLLSRIVRSRPEHVTA
jgi:peptidoglycan/LPS O-acetylase OafA/YrhL